MVLVEDLPSDTTTLRIPVELSDVYECPDAPLWTESVSLRQAHEFPPRERHPPSKPHLLTAEPPCRLLFIHSDSNLSGT